MKQNIPAKMKYIFWSYDLKSLDLEKDKNYIITQVLNHGKEEDLRWLFNVYPKRTIKNIVKNPSRGVWFEDILRFWSLMFDVKLSKKIKEKAIFNLNKKHP